MPGAEVSTWPIICISEPFAKGATPWTGSSAVAPGSVQVSPTLRLIVEEPTKVIVGYLNFTKTVLWREAELPAASVTL